MSQGPVKFTPPDDTVGWRTLWRPPSPPAPDHEVTDRALYDLAFALAGGEHEWGKPITLSRAADDGSAVTTTFKLPESPE